MKTYPVLIHVEADRTCSVLAPSINKLELDLPKGKITGLTPEQATNLKHALEDAYVRGWFDRFRKFQNELRVQVEYAPE